MSTSFRLDLLDTVTDFFLEYAFTQCSPLFAHSIHFAAEAVVHDTNLTYLDLAVPFPRHVHWKKRARTLFLRSLSHSCEEFFLAETVPPHQKFNLAFESTISNIRYRLSMFYSRLLVFRENLFPHFEVTIFDRISENPSQKNEFIQKYLRGYERFGIDRFTTAFPILLNICTSPPLDCEMTMELLRTMCDTNSKKKNVFTRVPNLRCLEILLSQAKAVRFDFWGLWSGNSHLSLTFDFFPQFMALNINEYSKQLLRYGFPYMVGPEGFERRCIRLMNTKFDGINVIESVDVFFQHANSEKMTRMMLIMDTFLIFGKFNRTLDYDGTLRYLTRCLPLPYVTPGELYSTMLEAVIPDFEPELSAIVVSYSLSDIFDDDFHTSTPRRLEHLCRVVIRKILADKFMLPDGIHELPIPGMLKNYLELHI